MKISRKTLKNDITSKTRHFKVIIFLKLIYIYIYIYIFFFFLFYNNIFYLDKKNNINLISLHLLVSCIIYYFTIIIMMTCLILKFI